MQNWNKYAYSDVIQEIAGNIVGLPDFRNNLQRKVWVYFKEKVVLKEGMVCAFSSVRYFHTLSIHPTCSFQVMFSLSTYCHKQLHSFLDYFGPNTQKNKLSPKMQIFSVNTVYSFAL